ncbi:interferon-induced protein 44-like, partial [Clarias magur]
ENNCIMGLFGSKQQPKDPEIENPWREVDWSNREQILQNLKQIRTSPGVDTLRILVVEPICAGKSSFITSVNTALQGRNTSLDHSLTDSIVSPKYAVYTVKDTEGSLFPFVFGDTMGVGDGESGACPEDIINILKGHVPEGYIFNPSMELTADSSDFNKNPALNDKIHCLVFVIPSNNIYIMRGITATLKPVLQSTCDLGIAQVIIMSKVDKACPLVCEDLKMIYRSQKIEDR